MENIPRDSNAELDRALREAEQEVSGKGPGPVPRVRPVRASPDSAIEREGVLLPEVVPDRSSPTNSAPVARNRRLFLAAALLFVLIAAGALRWRNAPEPPVVPQDILHSLVTGIEAYRDLHGGQLPETLAGLAAFPADAIEWPPEYWNARNLLGRDEIIWLPGADNSYRIVLRRGSDVRLYSSLDETTKDIGAGRVP